MREWAKDEGTIYLVTGAVFDHDGDGERDADEDMPRMESRERVAAPLHFYEVALHEKDNGFIESMTFLLQDLDDTSSKDETEGFLLQHEVMIDEVEELTGVDFFHGLPAQRGLSSDRLSRQFERCWPELQTYLANVERMEGREPPEPAGHEFTAARGVGAIRRARTSSTRSCAGTASSTSGRHASSAGEVGSRPRRVRIRAETGLRRV